MSTIEEKIAALNASNKEFDRLTQAVRALDRQRIDQFNEIACSIQWDHEQLVYVQRPPRKKEA